MTTRLYYSLDTAAPAISPAFDASWETTAQAVRRNLEFDKIDDANIAPANVTVSTGAINVPVQAVDFLAAQYISAPLSGSQTISGAISGYMRVAENSGSADIRAQMVVRVVDAAGTTVRGTLIPSNASALASEFGTTAQQRKMPLGTPVTPTSVNALDGDRIVVEIGGRKHENGATNRTGTFTLGALAGGTDNAANETDTVINVPWIEFADTLVFQTVLKARFSQAPLEALVQPDTQKARISQAVIEVLVIPVATGRRAFYWEMD